ncbi:hypothetical protein [Xylanimonas oleitrophica]|uniref:hypothetical protein n=1 Tax=Xylanimonas oleitrophica TaxID=2607479 RepID=UPI0011B3D017|nr:hypothetical protein [Xylanimonas oleitrophica]
MDTLISEYAPVAGRMVIFWDSLAIPSVEVDIGLLSRFWPEVVGQHAEFCVYFPEEAILVELSFAGRVTVAKVPKDASGS